MEAMAAGCPVAISRDVNLAEEVADANAGLIADAEPRAFAAGLLELLGDLKRRRRLSRVRPGVRRTLRLEPGDAASDGHVPHGDRAGGSGSPAVQVG